MQFITVDRDGLKKAAWHQILHGTDSGAMKDLLVELECAATYAPDEWTKRGQGYHYLIHRLRRCMDELELQQSREEEKRRIQAIAAEIMKGNDCDLTEALCYLNRGEFRQARGRLMNAEKRLEEVRNSELKRKALAAAGMETVSYDCETSDAVAEIRQRIVSGEAALGTKHRQGAKGIMSRFDANIRNKNVGGARSCLMQIYDSDELYCGLIAELESVEAVNTWIRKASDKLECMESHVIHTRRAKRGGKKRQLACT